MRNPNAVPTRAIVGSVITGGRIYKAGDEDALAARMAGRDMSHLIDGNHITGDWGQAAKPAAKPANDDAPEADDESEVEESDDEAPAKRRGAVAKSAAKRRR